MLVHIILPLSLPGVMVGAFLTFVITIEPCEQAALGAALDEILTADWHAEPPIALPMFLGGNP